MMTCPNCGEHEPHFVPPCFGDVGFFSCHDRGCASRKEPAEKCDCHLSCPIPESRPRGPAPLAQLQLDTIALQVHPMIGTDSDLRRGIERKLHDEIVRLKELHGGMTDNWWPTAAVSVAVGGIKAERGRAGPDAYFHRLTHLADHLDAVADGLKMQVATIRKTISRDLPPTEPEFDEHGQPCDMARTEPPRNKVCPHTEPYKNCDCGPPKECGCGTTGCTECWPREERCQSPLHGNIVPCPACKQNCEVKEQKVTP